MFISEDLHVALWQIGLEESDKPIRQEILDRLAELKIIEIQPGCKIELTTLGWELFTEIEAGPSPPEFEEP
jgi:hypothetical protein